MKDFRKVFKILTDKAKKRKTITYKELALIVNDKSPSALSRELRIISFYCISKGYPVITSIVRKVKGDLAYNSKVFFLDIENEADRVFSYDWRRLGNYVDNRSLRKYKDKYHNLYRPSDVS